MSELLGAHDSSQECQKDVLSLWTIVTIDDSLKDGNLEVNDEGRKKLLMNQCSGLNLQLEMKSRKKIPEALTGVHLRTSTLPDAGVSGLENHRSVRNMQPLKHHAIDMINPLFRVLAVPNAKYNAVNLFLELAWNLSHLWKILPVI